MSNIIKETCQIIQYFFKVIISIQSYKFTVIFNKYFYVVFGDKILKVIFNKYLTVIFFF